jgi:hypothetical protein
MDIDESNFASLLDTVRSPVVETIPGLTYAYDPLHFYDDDEEEEKVTHPIEFGKSKM